MHTRAIVRRPGLNFADGITTSGLGRPDFSKTLEQHNRYCEALTSFGLELTILEADERFPDGCFVEDTAVVTEEVAVITRPGAASRLGEEDKIAEVLEQFRVTERIKAPGTLDGGDILRVNKHFYIGLSDRTNKAGAQQLSDILKKYGYTASEVPVKAGLHLKSSIGYPGNGWFLASPGFESVGLKEQTIILSPADAYAANCLNVNGRLIMAEGYGNVRSEMLSHGFDITELDMSEFRKMDGGLTCLSILF